MSSIATAIVDNQNLARSGDHVDIDQPEDQLLGGRNIDIARAGNLVDLGDTLRPESQRSNGLSTANLEDAIDPGNLCRSQDMGVGHPVRHRHNHEHFFDPRDFGRNGIHQD